MTFLQLADAGRMREDITKELKTGGASVYGVLADRKAKQEAGAGLISTDSGQYSR